MTRQKMSTRSATGYAEDTSIPRGVALPAWIIGPRTKYQLMVKSEEIAIRPSKKSRVRWIRDIAREGRDKIPMRSRG